MKKAQAAMNFMFNYGWAILVLAAVVSVLSYLGVFSPGESSVSSCMMGPGFACKNYKSTELMMTLSIINAVYDVSSVSIGFDGDIMECAAASATERVHTDFPETGVKTNKWWFNSTGTIDQGKSLALFTFSGCTLAGYAQSDFIIYYVIEGEEVYHTINGQANLHVE
ncbi:MAG: hypothetical protein KKG59_05725 [Nanoarchaeota archaeon]|nr:hypothetical protein [Nanoarchaeota archaeon]